MSSKRDVHLYIKKDVYEKALKVSEMTETPLNVVLAFIINEEVTLSDMFNMAVQMYGKRN